MKQVLTTILSFLLFIGAFPETNTFLFFKLNQISIVNNHCVQKNAKTNTCQGKCYLKKQLEQNDNPSQPYTPNDKEIRNINLIYIEVEELSCPQPLINKKQSFHNSGNWIDRLAIDKLLRPPDYFIS